MSDDEQPWTVGELRDELIHLPPDQPIGIQLPDGSRAVVRDVGTADDAFVLHAEVID